MNDAQKRGRNNAIRGRNKEWAVRDWFIARGYHVVRGAGSHGMADIIAIPVVPDVVANISNEDEIANFRRLDTRQVWFIQVKSSKPYGKEFQEYKRFAETIPRFARFQIWIIPYKKGVDDREVIDLTP